MLATPKERDVETLIDTQLRNLGWIEDPTDIKRNVYKQSPRTEAEKKKLNGKIPDYVLYDDNRNAIVVIEAKKPHKNLDMALNQGIGYAKGLNAPIVIATDGIFTKTYHTKKCKPLYLNKEEVDDLISQSLALNYLNDNEYYNIDSKIVHSREELIRTFSDMNDTLRNAGVRAGIGRVELFCNLLFLKVISELSEQNTLIKILPNYCKWDNLKTKKGEELFEFINKQAFDHFKKTYGGEVLSPIPPLLNYKVLDDIIDKLDVLHLSSTSTDIKGDAFEYFLRNYGGSDTDFGEYFTPRHVVKSLVKMLNPKFGEKIYDPFCGTGGMLITSYKHIYDRMPRNEKTINDLKANTIYGGEISEMSRIAKMNMILAGDGHSNILRQDSYANPMRGKYDVVITNIPFGRRIKTDCAGLYGYDTKSGEITGVLHCIDALSDAENARAGIIIPEGIIFDKNNNVYSKLREQLVEQCSIETIVSLPPMTFAPNTNTKANMLIVKKQANKSRNHLWYFNVQNDGFTLDTKRIKIEGTNDIDILLSESNIDDSDKERLEKQGFSVLYKDQIRKNNYILKPNISSTNEQKSSKYELKKISDVCIIEYGDRITKKNNTGNLYPVYGGGDVSFYTNSYNHANSVVIARFAMSQICTRYVNGKFWLLDSGLTLKTNSDNLNQIYLNYLILSLNDRIYSFGRGIGQKNIDIDLLKSIEIPIPSLTEQQEIIDKLGSIENKIIQAENLIKSLKQDSITYSNYYKTNNYTTYRLGDLITFIKRGKTPKYGEGSIQIIKSGQNRGFFEFDFKEKYYLDESIIIKDTILQKDDLLINTTGVGTAGRIGIFTLKGMFTVDTHIKIIRLKSICIPLYTLIMLSSNYGFKAIEKMALGSTGQTELAEDTIKSLEIPIPSLEIQQQIVDEYLKQENYIKSLEELVIFLKNKTTNFLRDIIN